ncbi:hypothetical protein DN752_21915 [Echinicola strongylocentroti]|uniref:DUF218 domain-containing protein n=1 Tax=Echinicola strongylocentroti TaxID=1795355 RepID=A0A2Z4IPA3_9BACT|nr:YdcF family protein [Echinicola strongylocentroti]AWW32590.1 hypothetical protein DN752_21915 [Echinicola strongylocentroti]
MLGCIGGIGVFLEPIYVHACGKNLGAGAPFSQGCETGPETRGRTRGMAESLPGMERPIFHKGGDRLFGALELLQKSNQNMLLISGGAFYKRDVLAEASFIKSFLTNTDLIPNPIVAESTSTNTAQNARYCRDIFIRHDWPMDIVLVSSAFHLYRARKCFEKQGFQVETFATDPLESRTPKPMIHAFIPSFHSLQTWEYLLKEWLGTLYYHLKGEI